MLQVGTLGRRDIALGREAMLMRVEGWDFVSEHALAREYLTSAADVISVV